MGALTDYAEELRGHVGTRGPEYRVTVELGDIRRFARAIGDDNPLYHDPGYAATTSFGAVVAPPAFVPVVKARERPALPEPRQPFTRVLHAHDELELHAPIRAGDTVVSTAELAAVTVREGRAGEMLLETLRYEVARADGLPIASLTWTEVYW